MFGTETMFCDLRKLAEQGEDAVLVLRLAMSANDVALANHCLGAARAGDALFTKETRWGAGLYFIRLQAGHLIEGLKALREIPKSALLSKLVQRLPPDAQIAYERVLNCSSEPEWKSMKYFRNKLAFHYDPERIEKALESRASREGSRRVTMTRASELSKWRFGLADRIVDTIVCRNIWGIALAADLSAEADEKSDYGSELVADFLTFAYAFCWQYLSEFAAT